MHLDLNFFPVFAHTAPVFMLHSTLPGMSSIIPDVYSEVDSLWLILQVRKPLKGRVQLNFLPLISVVDLKLGSPGKRMFWGGGLSSNTSPL